MHLGIIDTSGGLIELAISEGAWLVSASRIPHTKENARNIAVHFENLLAKAEKLGGLTHVVVGVGPGSFIGTRTGVSFANGYALGKGLPVVGLNSMWSRAVDFLLQDITPVVVRNARRHSFYIGAYNEKILDGSPEGVLFEREAQLSECLELLKELGKSAESARQKRISVTTDSKEVYEAAIRAQTYLTFLTPSVVSLRGLAYIAQKVIERGATSFFAEPVYLRSPF